MISTPTCRHSKRRGALPRQTILARRCEELLVTAEASANLVVLRTPAGAAQFLGAAIDEFKKGFRAEG